MLDHLKALLAVAGGAVGVGGGAVTLTLHQSSIGGGDLSIASVSEGDVAREAVSLVSSESQEVSTESSTIEPAPVQVTVADQDTQSDEQLTHNEPVKEEEKENCSIIDFPTLNDVFYNLIDKNAYVLVSCSKTSEKANTDLSNKWTGLFPSQLFLNKEAGKKFKLTTETTGTSESGTVTFSSDILPNSPITGGRGDMFQATVKNKKFLVQEINLTEPQSSGKIFLVSVENVEFLR